MRGSPVLSWDGALVLIANCRLATRTLLVGALTDTYFKYVVGEDSAVAFW